MEVFKFGGASVCDASGVRNVGKVLKYSTGKDILIVVSAMGKTTNAMEKVVEEYLNGSSYLTTLAEIEFQHQQIVTELFGSSSSTLQQLKEKFNLARVFLDTNRSSNYDFVYDQVVSVGEFVSSLILSRYLDQVGISNQLLDAREYIKASSEYREAGVDWALTQERISQIEPRGIYVTQGFIGSESNNFTVTLGREGSDYSASIFAYCLNAIAVTVWKDVPGVLNADPRHFSETQLMPLLSYSDAIEMAYFGASVIHPKTIQPLQQKKIPFIVKSFLEPQKAGTKVQEEEVLNPVETFILKENQHLLSLSSLDFSFVTEEHLSYIIARIVFYKIKISLIQNTAISLQLCVGDKYHNLALLVEELKTKFEVEVISDVQLFTVRNYKASTLDKYYSGRNVLLEQMSKRTLQLVCKK